MDCTPENISSNAPQPLIEEEVEELTLSMQNVLSMPTREELNLDVTIEKEKKAIAKLAVCSTSRDARKSKKMRISPRARMDQNKHQPYWDVRKNLLLIDTCATCLIGLTDIITEFAKTASLDDIIENYRGHKCTDCAPGLIYHAQLVQGLHYKSEVPFGNENMDLNVPFTLLPGDMYPTIYQVMRCSYNIKAGPRFTIEKLNTQKWWHGMRKEYGHYINLHKGLFKYAFSVVYHGSFQKGFEGLFADGVETTYVHGKGYVISDREDYILDHMTLEEMSLVFVLHHGGLSHKEMPSFPNRIKKCKMFVPYERIDELIQLVHWAFRNARRHRWRKPGYRDIIEQPEFKPAYKVLHLVNAIYTYLCKELDLQPMHMASLAELVYLASAFWHTTVPGLCKHDNPTLANLRSGAFPVHTGWYHAGKGGQVTPSCGCVAKEEEAEALIKLRLSRKRRFDTPIEYEPPAKIPPQNIFGDEILPTSDEPSTETPTEPTPEAPKGKFASFWSFMKSCYEMPEGAPEPDPNATPEEGGTPAGSMRPISTWLKDAIDYFFRSLKDFISNSFSEFKTILSKLWNSIIETVKAPLDALGGMLTTIASPIIAMLGKLLKSVGLGYWLRGRNLTVDVYAAIIGVFVYNSVTNPLLRLMITAFFLQHFNIIRNVHKFVNFLRTSMFSDDVPELIYEFVNGFTACDEPEPTSMIPTFLTHLASSNMASVCVKVFMAVIFSVTGIAACSANKASLAKVTVELFRNLSFIGQGINGIGKIWTTIATGIPAIFKWIRSKLDVESEDDKKEKERIDMLEKVGKKLMGFIVSMKSWDNEEGYATIKRSKKMQDHFVQMRPIAMMLYRLSFNVEYKDLFPREIYTQFIEAFKSYNKIFNVIYRVCAYGEFRRTPFHIQFMGKPGVGKSTLLHTVSNHINKTHLDSMPQNHLVYARGNTDHFDGYSNQPIMVQDDMWAADDYQQVAEILTLVSNAPVVLPMANLTDKATFFTSQFILSTTNTAFPTTTSIRCNEAIWRRRHIFTRVKIDPDVYNEQSSKFDLQKFKKCSKYAEYNNGTEEQNRRKMAEDMPHLKFDVLCPVPNRNGSEFETGTKEDPKFTEYSTNDIPAGLTEPLTDLTFKQFMVQVNNRYKAIYDEETLIRDDKEKRLDNVKEVFKLIRTIHDEIKSDYLFGPTAKSFMGFDFCGTPEAEEEETPMAEDFTNTAEDAPEEEAREFTWEDIDDNYEFPEFKDEKGPTSGNTSSWENDVHASDEDVLLILKRLCELAVPPYTEYEIVRIDTAPLYSFITKYSKIIPPDMLIRFKGAMSKVNILKDRHANYQRHYDEIKNKHKSKRTKKERKQFDHYTRYFNGFHGTSTSTEADPTDPTPPPPPPRQDSVPDFEDDDYAPCAGEFHIPAKDHLAKAPRKPMTRCRKEWLHGKTTVDVTCDGTTYLRMCNNMVYDEVYADIEHGAEDKIFGKFAWGEQFRDNAIFHPKKANPDDYLAWIKANDPDICNRNSTFMDDWEHSKATISALPLDFLTRINIIEFKQPYFINGGDIPLTLREKDFAFRESASDGTIGVTTRDALEAYRDQINKLIRIGLTTEERELFDKAEAKRPYNRLMRVRQEQNGLMVYPSPLFMSRKYITYVDMFLRLPPTVKHAIASLYDKVTPKCSTINEIRRNYREYYKHYMMKLTQLLHKDKPKPWMIGVGDLLVTGIIGIFAACVYQGVRSAVGALFGGFGTPKPTSRTMFKRAPQPFLRSPAQKTSSQALEDMHRVLCKNLVMIRCGKQNANALGIAGQSIICNAHVIRPEYEKEQDFVIEWKPTQALDEWWEATIRHKDIKIIPDSDLAIITSVDFRMFKDIRSRFITQNTLENNELPEYVYQSFYNSDAELNVNIAPVTKIIQSMQVRFLDNTIRNVVEYESPRVPGMSGSPLYADLPYAQNQMVWGIQSCASSKKSYANIITQELLAEYMPKVIVHEGPIVSEEGVTPTSELIIEHVGVDGTIPTKLATGFGGETELFETPLAKEFPSQRIPAILKAFDPRVPIGTHPLQHSVNKFGRNSIKSMPTKVIDKSVHDITRIIRQRLQGKKLKVLSLEESILGLKEEGFEKINIKTSPGLPWLWDKVRPGKKTWVDIGEDGNISLLADDLIEEFNSFDSQLQQGIIPQNSFYEFPKDELRPIEKALTRTRSITVMNFTFSLLYRKYTLDLEAALHKMADGTFPACVGINPHSRAWANMYAELSKRSKTGNDFDISNWDGHFPGWLFDAVARVFNNLYNDEFSVARQAIFRNACFGYTNFLDLVLQKNRGMPSGFAGTATVNTIGHLILFYCFYILQSHECNHIPTLQEFICDISCFFYGDDVVFTISTPLKDIGITPQSFINWYRHFGWPITSASKLADPSIERSINQLTFLKRSFQPDPLFGNSIIYGKIEESVIFDLLHWQRKGPNNYQQLCSNIMEALEFAYPYGKVYYNELIKRICSVMQNTKQGMIVVPSYSEQRSILVERYLSA